MAIRSSTEIVELAAFERLLAAFRSALVAPVSTLGRVTKTPTPVRLEGDPNRCDVVVRSGNAEL